MYNGVISAEHKGSLSKIQENNDKCSVLQYEFSTIKALELDMFRPFVGHPQ